MDGLISFAFSIFFVLFANEKPQNAQIETQEKCVMREIKENKILKYEKEDELVSHAYSLSNGNLDFIYTVERESGFSPNAIGDGGNSKGLCQWNIRWHKEIRNHQNFNDGKWQVERCYEYYSAVKKNNTIQKRLYGYKKRMEVKNRFSIVKIKKNVCF